MKEFLAAMTVVVGLVFVSLGLTFIIDYFVQDGPMVEVLFWEEKISLQKEITVGLIGFLFGCFLVVCGIAHPWPWVRREFCSDCHVNKTREKDENGFRVCEKCSHERWKKALILKAEEKAAGQPLLRCPHDGELMGKLVLSGSSIVADNCEKCGRIVLEKEESEELEAKLNQPRGGGSFSGGMMLGMSLGRMG